MAPVLAARHDQLARARLEGNESQFAIERGEHQPGAGQRRVTAQIDLGGRREPAQIVAPRRGLHEEGRFGQIVLARDLLHQPGVDPGVERHHRGRVSLERLARERIDLPELQFHRDTFRFEARTLTRETRAANWRDCITVAINGHNQSRRRIRRTAGSTRCGFRPADSWGLGRRHKYSGRNFLRRLIVGPATMNAPLPR